MEKELAKLYEREIKKQSGDGIKLRAALGLQTCSLQLISKGNKILAAVVNNMKTDYFGFDDRFSVQFTLSDFYVAGIDQYNFIETTHDEKSQNQSTFY